MTLSVDIQKRLGSFLLRVSFSTQEGITGLLGASGCGKSVTLKCIAGLMTPDSGKIVLNDRVLFDSSQNIDIPAQKRRVGYLFQQYALFPNMTVARNIAAGVRERHRRPEEVRRLLTAFQIADCADRYPQALSGGQQQRAALARILASHPEALLLDEPFSALDSSLKLQVEAELSGYLSSFRGPILFVSHDQAEIRRSCQTVCVLHRGSSQAMLSAEALFTAPRTLSACRLSGCRNISAIRLLPDRRAAAEQWGATLSLPADAHWLRQSTSVSNASEKDACGSMTSRADSAEGDTEGKASDTLARLSHIGIHAHRIRLREEAGPNRIPCRLLAPPVNEGAVRTLLLSTPGGTRRENLLCVSIAGDTAAALPALPGTLLWAELPTDALMLLRDGEPE